MSYVPPQSRQITLPGWAYVIESDRETSETAKESVPTGIRHGPFLIAPGIIDN
jgi:hypothetical protein